MTYLIPAHEIRRELTVVNSRFIATLAPVASTDEARAFIVRLRKEFADASHNVPAYIIGGGNSVTEYCSDDGEPAGTSGRPALTVLRGSGLGDVAVVVTRYFGGTLLGTGGLVKAYTEATQLVVHAVPRAERRQVHVALLALLYNLLERVRINMRDMFLPYLAKSNWRACNFASQYGFKCADSFAQFMAADFDTNGDGAMDADAIAYQLGESEASYVTRITSTLKATLRDANYKRPTSTTTVDYILSDNTHPTYQGSTVYVGLFGGTGSTTTAPDYTDAQIVGGKNPGWNQLGHERMGWALSVFNPAAPSSLGAAGPLRHRNGGGGSRSLPRLLIGIGPIA